MKTLIVGVSLFCAAATVAAAQERSADRIARDLKAAIARDRAPSDTRSLGPSRTIVMENGIDAERMPEDPEPRKPAPAAAAQPQAATAPPAAGGRIRCTVAAEFRKIYFTRGSAALGPDPMTQQTLATLADALAMHDFEGVRFWIRGHTDSTGGLPLNMSLSSRRAANVARFMIASGVPADRVRSVGRGPLEPADASDPAGEVNRRVDVCVETL